MIHTQEYRYKLSNMNNSSAYYGNCEVCNKHVDTVYLQTEENKFILDSKERWTTYKCHTLFGHKDCLIGKQKVNVS